MRTALGTTFHIAARSIAVAVTLCALAAGTAVVGPSGTRARAQVPAEPNILIILTDDQRPTRLAGVMPETKRLFIGRGTRFTNAYATTPLCCPSRASIFSGRYAHNHGAENNAQADRFDERSGIQRYLQERGYRTAIFGKYLLGRPNSANPAHFDEWATFRRSPSAYRDGLWNVGGTVQRVPGYSTTYIEERAVQFINERETLDVEPWMMMLSTAAPHAPYTPERRYRGTRVPRWEPNPAIPEQDLSDKSPVDGLGETTVRKAKRVRRKQFRTLRSVDDMVERVFATLNRSGEQNTLAFFLSDNGFLWADHGLFSKRYPYIPSSKIPFLMRWPGRVEAGDVDRDLVGTIDVAPTIMQAAGITPDPEYPVDGQSLLGGVRRNRLLLEFRKEHNIWTWASTITRDYQYIEYYDDSGATLYREYYNLRRDPWQLRNLYGDDTDSNDPDRAPLSRQLTSDRSCSGASCP